MDKPDKKFVVIKNGQRVSDLLETQEAAQAEADRLKKLEESKDKQAQPAEVTVKQHLEG